MQYVTRMGSVLTLALLFALSPDGHAGQKPGETQHSASLHAQSLPSRHAMGSIRTRGQEEGGPPGTLSAPARKFVSITRGDPNRKEIALTFDDGPHPHFNFTARLLDLLHALNLRVTFFLVGERVDQTPYLVERMVQEGHEVANHTYHHANLKKIPPELVEDEMRLCNEAVQRASGVRPTLFRPPGGQFSGETVVAADKLRMLTVLWTDDPGDYAHPAPEVLEQKLLNHIRNGAVILLHDGVEETYDILPDLVARLRQQGYRFVTITEMAQYREASSIVH